MGKLLDEVLDYFKQFGGVLEEQTTSASVFPDKLVDVHSPASTGYVEANLPVVLKHVYFKMSDEGKQKFIALLKELDKYFDSVEGLTNVLTAITKTIEHYVPTIESSEVARIYRIAGDVSYFLQALLLGSFKGLRNIEK